MSQGLSRTSLTRHAHAMRDADPQGAMKAAKTAWHQHGMIVVFPEQLKSMGSLERQLFEAVANKQYGQRPKGK